MTESDIIKDDVLDIEWANMYDNVIQNFTVQRFGLTVTNVTYAVVFGDGPIVPKSYADTNTVVTVCPTFINRRYEKVRSIPSPIISSVTSDIASFRFRVDGEDQWASQFGTTYTAYKVKVYDGEAELWDSGIRRLPARDALGDYTLRIPTPNEISSGPTSMLWRVAVYNSKFRTDTFWMMDFGSLSNNFERVFSPPQTITRQ